MQPIKKLPKADPKLTTAQAIVIASPLGSVGYYFVEQLKWEATQIAAEARHQNWQISADRKWRAINEAAEGSFKSAIAAALEGVDSKSNDRDAHDRSPPVLYTRS